MTATQTMTELEARLHATCQDILDNEAPQENVRQWTESRKGTAALADAYSMGANLGYLRSDVRFLVWGGLRTNQGR